MLSEQEKSQNLRVFQKVLCSTGNFMFWKYSPAFVLLETNSTSTMPLELFEKLGGKQILQSYSDNRNKPVVIWTDADLIWIADFDRDDDQMLLAYYLIGPMNSAESVTSMVQDGWRKLNIPAKWIFELLNMSKTLPLMISRGLIRYSQMLHSCLTDEYIDRADVDFYQENHAKRAVGEDSKKNTFISGKFRRSNLYLSERAVLQHIREGSMNYQEEWSYMEDLYAGIQVQHIPALQNHRVTAAMFMNSCAVEAVEAGLSAEIVLAIRDSYLQSLFQANDIGNIRSLKKQMFEEMVETVHRVKQNKDISKPIRDCCEYINRNVESDISAEGLAEMFGYTKYYLTHKFQKEVGISLAAYIKASRIERAKSLLVNTEEGIQEISERLHYCSRSYFSRLFQEQTGVTPVQYRKQHGR